LVGSVKNLSVSPSGYVWFLYGGGSILISDFSATSPSDPSSFSLSKPVTTDEFYEASWIGNTGWLFSGDGTTTRSYKTLDGGISWSSAVIVNALSLSFKNAKFINEDIGFIFFETSIYKTVDGGASWAEYTTAIDLQTGYVIDEDSILMGTASTIQKFTTEDGWISASLLGVDIRGIDGFENRISAAGDGVIYHSYDYGDSWTLSSSPLFVLDDISIVSNTLGIIASNGAIYRYY
jgi:photosystem II stability/assembly factor-like uncharacterized protein